MLTILAAWALACAIVACLIFVAPRAAEIAIFVPVYVVSTLMGVALLPAMIIRDLASRT